MSFIKKFLNEETILYLVFGVLTTVVNFGSFALFQVVFGETYYLLNNIGSFICAVTFAFVTNKQFVFKSKSWKIDILCKEFISFFTARILSFLIIEEGGLFLCVNILGFNQITAFGLDGMMISKIVLAFVSVVVNYVAGKFFVFSK